MIENLYSWVTNAVLSLLFMHLFSCGWLLINQYKKDWEEPAWDTQTESNLELYAISFYLVTSTMSTVGYGDHKAFMDNSGSW